MLWTAALAFVIVATTGSAGWVQDSPTEMAAAPLVATPMGEASLSATGILAGGQMSSADPVNPAITSVSVDFTVACEGNLIKGKKTTTQDAVVAGKASSLIFVAWLHSKTTSPYIYTYHVTCTANVNDISAVGYGGTLRKVSLYATMAGQCPGGPTECPDNSEQSGHECVYDGLLETECKVYVPATSYAFSFSGKENGYPGGGTVCVDAMAKNLPQQDFHNPITGDHLFPVVQAPMSGCKVADIAYNTSLDLDALVLDLPDSPDND